MGDIVIRDCTFGYNEYKSTTFLEVYFTSISRGILIFTSVMFFVIAILQVCSIKENGREPDSFTYKNGRCFQRLLALAMVIEKIIWITLHSINLRRFNKAIEPSWYKGCTKEVINIGTYLNTQHYQIAKRCSSITLGLLIASCALFLIGLGIFSLLLPAARKDSRTETQTNLLKENRLIEIILQKSHYLPGEVVRGVINLKPGTGFSLTSALTLHL